MSTRSALAALALSALVLPLTLSAPALASHGGGEVTHSGHCSGSAHWKLKAKGDDGRIEVEAEVDSNRAGQVWHWRLRHNGSTSATGRATTHGTSGSFGVRRRMADLAGTDHFGFRAERRATGEICHGTISL